MIEHRSAERRMEHPIAQGELLRQPPVDAVGQIVVAHNQTAGIGHGGELVHAAAIDLQSAPDRSDGPDHRWARSPGHRRRWRTAHLLGSKESAGRVRTGRTAVFITGGSLS